MACPAVKSKAEQKRRVVDIRGCGRGRDETSEGLKTVGVVGRQEVHDESLLLVPRY
jgi:hypothetical protein